MGDAVEIDNEVALTAMCIWEWMLENRSGVEEMRQEWSTCGTVAMRDVALSLAADVDRVWQLTSGDYGACFDWEFVPYVMQFVDWNNSCFIASNSRLAQLAIASQERRTTR